MEDEIQSDSSYGDDESRVEAADIRYVIVMHGPERSSPIRFRGGLPFSSNRPRLFKTYLEAEAWVYIARKKRRELQTVLDRHRPYPSELPRFEICQVRLKGGKK